MHTNTLGKLALLTCLTLTSAGCATIFSGSHDPITFNSIPEGAVVEINGARVGKTPVTIPIKRSITPPQVRLKLADHEPQAILLQNTFNAVALLDILFWPGFIVDAATGSLMKYDMVSYEAELEPKK